MNGCLEFILFIFVALAIIVLGGSAVVFGLYLVVVEDAGQPPIVEGQTGLGVLLILVGFAIWAGGRALLGSLFG